MLANEFVRYQCKTQSKQSKTVLEKPFFEFEPGRQHSQNGNNYNYSSNMHKIGKTS